MTKTEDMLSVESSRERTYGTTNIQRWKHGWMLLKKVVFAARRIKFT